MGNKLVSETVLILVVVISFTVSPPTKYPGYYIYTKMCPIKNLAKILKIILARSFQDLTRVWQEIKQYKIILASSKSWHGFGTDFLPTCQILKCLGVFLIGNCSACKDPRGLQLIKIHDKIKRLV